MSHHQPVELRDMSQTSHSTSSEPSLLPFDLMFSILKIYPIDILVSMLRVNKNIGSLSQQIISTRPVIGSAHESIADFLSVIRPLPKSPAGDIDRQNLPAFEYTETRAKLRLLNAIFHELRNVNYNMIHGFLSPYLVERYDGLPRLPDGIFTEGARNGLEVRFECIDKKIKITGKCINPSNKKFTEDLNEFFIEQTKNMYSTENRSLNTKSKCALMEILAAKVDLRNCLCTGDLTKVSLETLKEVLQYLKKSHPLLSQIEARRPSIFSQRTEQPDDNTSSCYNAATFASRPRC